MAAFNVPCVQPFDSEISGSEAAVGPKWDRWLVRFENYLAAIAVTGQDQRRALLLHAVGCDTFDVFMNLPNKGVTYEEAKTALTDYFKPKVNREYERAVFRRLRQQPDERIDAYHTRLRQGAASCEFADLDGELKSHVIQTTTDSKLRKQGLKDDNLTLKNIIEIGRNNELAQVQNTEMEKDLPSVRQESVHKVHYNKKTTYKKTSPAMQSHTKSCRYCGKNYPHKGGQNNCPAFGRKCYKCQGNNHFASLCTSKSDSKNAHRQTVHEVKECNTASSVDNDKDYVFAVNKTECYLCDSHDKCNCVHTLNDSYINGVNCKSKTFVVKPPKFRIEFGSSCILMTADSGASCSIIDKETFDSKFKHIKLEYSDNTLSAYGGSRIETVGQFKSMVRCAKKTATDVFYVVKCKSGNILSVNTSQKLGLLKVADHTVNNITNDYPNVFEGGIGKLKDFEVKLHIDENIPCVAQRHRRIPFHQRQKVSSELENLEKNDIIERVSGPTPWVSPIVVVPKPKSPGEVRICVDMRQANKAIMRERHPTPTVDDIVNQLNNARIFSKVDLKSGYHQLVLAEESRYITTFSTHAGLWRYKRLNFGISSASEVFQNVIANVIHGIDGAFNMSDDIFIFGKGQTEKEATQDHDKHLEEVLKRLQKCGLTANPQKCEFRKHQMEFYGMMFSKEGIAPDPKKIKAVLVMNQPESVGEIQSLLGMTNFLARFIPGYSTVTSPIRKLTHKDEEFRWESEQVTAFNQLKDLLCRAPVVAYFDKSRKTEIIVDASPVGLSGILVQFHEKVPRVVAYGCKALTPVEQRYSQLEREALAVVWACKHFNLYVFGAPVKVVTDHKPLVTIFGTPSAKLPLRLERWAMRLLPYQPIIEYRKGKDNPSDYLSRHAQSSDKSSREELIAEEYVNYIADQCIPKAMTSIEILEGTLDDPTLSAVKELLLTDQWYLLESKYGNNTTVDYQDIQSYSKVRNELTVSDAGLLLRGTRIAVPTNLQTRVLELAHEGHQGIERTKALLREKVWFPGIDAKVAHLLERCIACKATYDPKVRQPIVMSDLPVRKWSQLCADFYGPLPSGDYLLVVLDEYSRFPEVEIIRSLSANTVIPVMDKLFSSRGTPDKLKTDNGSPFQSEEFKNFAKCVGFHHQRITPYWPEANGMAERFMRTIGKVCKCAQIEGKSWKQELYRFLRNYRATPHKSTGLPPATVLNGKPLKTKLPQIHEAEEDNTLRAKDYISKKKMKIYAESRRNITDSNIDIGDRVLLKNVTKGKLIPKFQQEPFEVVNKKGSMISAQRGHEVKARNTSHFRKVITDIEPLHYQPDDTDPAPMPEPLPSESQPATQPVPMGNTNSPRVNHSPPTSVPITRPQRVRKVPKHFEGFDVKIPGNSN